MKLSTATSFVLALAAVDAFAPAFKPPTKAISSSFLNGIFYLDDVYVPTESPETLPPGAIPAMSPPSVISEGQVRALFYLWNDALATGDSRIVAKRYSSDPLLLPTVSDKPRTDYDSIKDYFDNFLTKAPQGIILDGHITIGNGWARDAGIYEFTMGTTGDKVKARYTFVYVYEHGQWKISHHHSSVMPEASKSTGNGVKVTVDQIRNLFYLWNDALGMFFGRTAADVFIYSARPFSNPLHFSSILQTPWTLMLSPSDTRRKPSFSLLSLTFLARTTIPSRAISTPFS